jgi:hypothetical protein
MTKIYAENLTAAEHTRIIAGPVSSLPSTAMWRGSSRASELTGHARK